VWRGGPHYRCYDFGSGESRTHPLEERTASDVLFRLFEQNVFITGDGQAGALAELEKRKFTAEEGVSRLVLGSSSLNER